MDILVTKRLTLRPPLEVDADAITQNLQNPAVARMLTHVPSPYSVEDAQVWINSLSAQENALYFSIYRQKMLGVVSVRENADGVPDLGYWLSQDAWGNGFMTEAARATLSHGFRKFDWQEIGSGAYEDNPASYAVLEKLGFKPAGTAVHSNPTRKCEIACKRVLLTRKRFEQMFGSLETDMAA